jgi:hypothetical protein
MDSDKERREQKRIEKRNGRKACLARSRLFSIYFLTFFSNSFVYAIIPMHRHIIYL